MASTKKYFQDHLVLLLLSTNLFLALCTTVLVVARLGASHGSSYIVQYRSSLGINAFKTGDVSELLGFIVFAVSIVIIQVLISVKTYRVNRLVSLVVLSLGILLLLLTIIISNALLALH